ncbi:unnamed protein product, partial [Urochloa humidicola]
CFPFALSLHQTSRCSLSPFLSLRWLLPPAVLLAPPPSCCGYSLSSFLSLRWHGSSDFGCRTRAAAPPCGGGGFGEEEEDDVRTPRPEVVRGGRIRCQERWRRPDPAPARAAAMPRVEDMAADGDGGRGANLLGAAFFEGGEEEDLGKQMARIFGGN